MSDGPVDRRRRLSALLEAARADLIAEIEAGRGGRAALRRFATAIDDLIRGLFRAAESEASTKALVVAVGGYGRRTLCLHSDIDLLLLFEADLTPRDEQFVKAFLHPLWDLRLEVGHQVRALADLQRLERDNPEFLLALVDARPLAGDLSLFEPLKILQGRSSLDGSDTVLETLLRLVRARHARFNDTLYQLEPDVKEAPGGLRDLAAIKAIAALAAPVLAQSGVTDAPSLRDTEDFLLRVRSCLHLASGRNFNVLTHPLQERAADRLGYEGAQPHQRVEALMGDYFRHARLVWQRLRRSCRALETSRAAITRAAAGDNLEIVLDGVTFVDPARAALEPASWLEAFEVALARNVPVADEALGCIERYLNRHPAADWLRTDEQAGRVLRLLGPRPGLFARLAEMHECGLLGCLFPEFRAITSRVIRDFHHRYTVDEHTLLAIRNVERLGSDAPPSRQRFAGLLGELHAPELLVLALLFHDVGKAKDEEHVGESLRAAAAMCDRLRLSAEPRALVEFLIGQHLLMSRVAFRRDTEDPEVVRQFAAVVGTEERLKMLCLLTLADVDAVSPGTLTPWKEELLWRLYVDAYNHMTLGYGDDLIDRGQAGLEALMAGRPADLEEGEIAAFLDGFPRRYLQTVSPARICDHVRLARDLHPDEVHLSLERAGGVCELTVLTLDKPFLFSNISGALSYFGMDILRGQALTSRHGLVLDLFQFTDREDFLRMNPDGEGRLFHLMREVVAGRADVASLLRGRTSSVMYRRGAGRSAPVVHVDNEYSRRYTVLEIVAPDAPGLLYRMSRAISRHGVDINLVLIATEGHTASDVFHLTKQGAKLGEADRLALTHALARVLERGEEADPVEEGHEADQGNHPPQQVR